MNAFFSGSIKVSQTTTPYFYPANIHTSDGKDFDPQNPPKDLDPFDLSYLVKGYINKETY